MANFSIKIDLLKLRSAFLGNITGRTATKRCLCIPLDDCDLFLGEKGLYLDLTAIELKEPKFKDTHCVKVSLAKERYDALSDDEKKALPIVGGMAQLEIKQKEMPITTNCTLDNSMGDDDLPF